MGGGGEGRGDGDSAQGGEGGRAVKVGIVTRRRSPASLSSCWPHSPSLHLTLVSPLTPGVPAQDEFADFVVDEDEKQGRHRTTSWACGEARGGARSQRGQQGGKEGPAQRTGPWSCAQGDGGPGHGSGRGSRAPPQPPPMTVFHQGSWGGSGAGGTWRGKSLERVHAKGHVHAWAVGQEGRQGRLLK